MASFYSLIHNPACEVKQNVDSMPERLGLGVQLGCLSLEGNIKLPVLRLGFIKNQVTVRKDELQLIWSKNG